MQIIYKLFMQICLHSDLYRTRSRVALYLVVLADILTIQIFIFLNVRQGHGVQVYAMTPFNGTFQNIQTSFFHF